MFALPEPTPATLRHLNLRDEKFGAESVTALDADFSVILGNASLAMFDAGLLDMLYEPVDESQDSIPGEAQPRTELRCAGTLKTPHALVSKLEGRTVLIERGEIGEADCVELTSARVHKISADPMVGGSVEYRFQVQKSKAAPGAVGALSGWLGKPVRVSFAPSEPVEEEPADPPPIEKDATTLFLDAAEKTLDERVAAGEPAWPFPTGAAPKPEKPPQHLVEPTKKERKAVERKEAGQKLPMKYRDAATGDTWSGRGVMPKWLKVGIERTGKTLADFEVAKAH